MIDEAEKSRIVSEILESPEFRDSRRYQDLLQYLVRETLAGRVPKEITIGTDFFRKDSNFDPKEDPTVRVYLNNLRKKLEHFYLTSGRNHSYKLEIPKGHYEVEFKRSDGITETPPSNKVSRTTIIVASAAFLLVIAFFVREIIRKEPASAIENNPIWTEFLKPNGRPTLVVLGDFFFLFERSRDGQTGNFVRNLNINSIDDFKAMIKQDPALASRYVQSNFTFLRPSASWGLAHVLPILQHSPHSVSLKLASEFTIDELKTNNVVFVGSFKTLYNLQKLLHMFELEYSLAPSRFEIKGKQFDSARVFLPQEIKGGNYEKDFAVVAEGAGPEGSTILMLLGFSDSGVIEACRATTDQQTVGYISNRLDRNKPPYFTLIVETEGFKQAIFKTEIRNLIQYPPRQDTASRY